MGMGFSSERLITVLSYLFIIWEEYLDGQRIRFRLDINYLMRRFFIHSDILNGFFEIAVLRIEHQSWHVVTC